MPVLCTSVRKRRVQRCIEIAFPAVQASPADLASSAHLADHARDGAP
jgi:hypothetical protein